MCNKKTHHTRLDVQLKASVWDYRVVFFAKLVLGPPHDHDTFQTCQTWRVGVLMVRPCATKKLTTHDSTYNLKRVFGTIAWCFLPSWCLVHHTTMTPFKRARRGEWAS